MDLSLILSKYYSEITGWSLSDNDYEKLIWTSETPKPSLEELEAKWSEYLAEQQATEYQRQRKVEYPSWESQLDMMFHDYDGWKASIQAIKDKYPKPVLVVEPEEMEAEPLILPEEEVTSNE